MTREAWLVECVGTFSVVSLWKVGNSGVAGEGGQPSRGVWGGTILGNDALIVANEVIGSGGGAACHLVYPTRTDVDAAVSLLGASAVIGVGVEEGPLTRSLCLEDPSGKRRWVMSRIPSGTSMPLGPIVGDLVYADCYPELVEVLNDQAPAIQESIPIYANLSSIESVACAPRLIFRPAVVQASLAGGHEKDGALDLAKSLLERTGANKAFVTMGAGGAVLAVRNDAWHCQAPPIEGNSSALGAGAVFSSWAIRGMFAGREGVELLDYAITHTAERLKMRRGELHWKDDLGKFDLAMPGERGGFEKA